MRSRSTLSRFPIPDSRFPCLSKTHTTMITVLGQIRTDLGRFIWWCQKHRLKHSIGTRIAHNRFETSFQYKTNCCPFTPDSRGYIHHRITGHDTCPEVEELGRRFLPGWHQASLYLYKAPSEKHSGGYETWHCSHSIFRSWQVAIVSEAIEFHIATHMGKSRAWEEPEKYQSFAIAPGAVFKFNSKMGHCISPVQKDTHLLLFGRYQEGWQKWLVGSSFLEQGSYQQAID